MIINLPMIIDPQIIFAMLSFCYAQWPNYLHHTIFPSPSILQRYTKFDACTITMLEKILGLGSFGTIVGHLAHCQVTFLTSSGGLGFPLVVQCAILAFLKCWVLIIFALVSHFQHDDHLTLLDAVAH
jgi:hypothetical protein